MLLTSIERCKASLGITGSEADGLLARLVASCSARVEAWLKRPLLLAARTEVISPYTGQRKFYMTAYPIITLTSVKYDPAGDFTGDEMTLDGVVTEGRAVVVQSPITGLVPFPMTRVPNTVRITYTGGLAESGTVSTWTVAANTSFVVGKYIAGSLSGAIGRITAKPTGGLTLDVLAGAFLAGETITEYTTFSTDLQSGGLTTATGVTSTMTAAVSLALCEAYPAITEAVEMYVRYLRTNRFSFEASSTGLDGTTRTGREGMGEDYFAFPEIRDLLLPYKNQMNT